MKKLTYGKIILIGAGSVLALAFLNLAGWATYALMKNFFGEMFLNLGVEGENTHLFLVIIIAFVGAILLGGGTVTVGKFVKKALD